MSSPANYIRGFRGQRVLVIGDVMLDVYERGATERLCREAPAPVVNLEDRVFNCGGAANTAVNTAALGGDVTLLSIVGDDANGRQLVEELQRAGVRCDDVIVSDERRTIAKKRVCASSNILVRVDEGDVSPIDDEAAARLARIVEATAGSFDVVILSDYGCGVFTDSLIEQLRKLKLQAPLLVDAKRPDRFRYLSPLAVKPNYEEARALLNIPRMSRGDRVEQILACGERLLETTGATAVACTLDMDGTVLFERSKAPYLISCVPQHDRQTVGAGDSFVGTLALGVAGGAPLRAAARLAATAAAVVLGKDGTGVCSAEELRAGFRGHDKRAANHADLLERVQSLRKHRKRVVFTNGCFDLLHRGHVEFLQQARALGDALVVALNDDAGIRRIKGDGRPVNTLEDRMEVLAGLEAVDLLVSFEGDSPIELLRQVRPDVFAKGGTYSIDSLPEAAEVRHMGGDVEIVPFYRDLSTSELIQRIQQRDKTAYGGSRRAL